MTEQPLVSVVVPTYNRASIIGKTIDNIFEQTYRNIELIVVDDGSTDGTKDVLASYGKRIRWVCQPNAGAPAARNRGAEMAKGEIVAFQDSDDSWHAEKIARQVSLLSRAGETVTCCVCNTNILTIEGNSIDAFALASLRPQCEEGIWTNVAELMATRFFIFCQAVAVRKKVLEKIGGYDERLSTMQDHEMAIRLAYEGAWAFIRTPLVIQKQGSENSISRSVMEQPIAFAQQNLLMWEIVMEQLPQERRGTRLQALIKGQLTNAKRALKIAEATYGKSRAGRMAAPIWSRVERYRAALARRMPGYPRMEVRPIQDEVRPAPETFDVSTANASATSLR